MAEQTTGAEVIENGGEVQNGANTNTDTNTPTTPTVEELMAQLATERANSAKNKAALDKALKDNGNLTKSLRAKQTAEEQEAEAKAEQEAQQKAYVEELETYKKTNEAQKRYALQGMNAEMAAKAAEAEISGDMDALSDIQKSFTAQLLKENDAKWMKQTPQPHAGGQYSSMTVEQIMAIKDIDEQRKAIAQNLDLFK